MTYQDTYVSFRTALISSIGTGPVSTVDAQALPNMSPMNMMAIVCWATPLMAKAIGNFNRSYNGQTTDDYAAVEVDTQTGVPTGFGNDTQGIGAGPYLASVNADPNRPWLRTPDPGKPESVYSVWSGGLGTGMAGLDSGGNELEFLKQAIADWQKMCDGVSAGIINGDPDMSIPSALDEIQLFWSAFGAWCSDMDVLEESPPPTIDVAEELRNVAGTASEFIGKAAATVAEQVGEVAGRTVAGLTGGFFENAGLLSVAVAALAVYLFILK